MTEQPDLFADQPDPKEPKGRAPCLRCGTTFRGKDQAAAEKALAAHEGPPCDQWKAWRAENKRRLREVFGTPEPAGGVR